MASSSAWGIEIGSYALKAVRLERNGDDVSLADFAYVPHKKVLSTPDVDGDEMIRLAIGQFMSQQPDMRQGPILVSVPGNGAFARFAKLPPVEPKKVPDIVKFEAVQQIPFPIEEVEWDYETFTSEETPEVEVGIFAITKGAVQARLNLYNELGLVPDGINISPVAAYNALQYDMSIQADSPGTIILDIGTTSTDLIIAEGGRTWIRTFPIGGHNFTEALINSFKLTYSKAEKLKSEAQTSKYRRQILSAMRPVFGDLAQDVQRSIGYYQSLHRDANLTRLIGVGSTFKLPGLRKFLSQQVQMEISRLDEFKRLSSGSNAVFAEHILNSATAYGLALQGLGLAAIDVNLIPVSVVRDRLWSEKIKWFGAAAALVVFGSMIAFARPMIDNGYTSQSQDYREIDKTIADAQKLKSEFDEITRATEITGKPVNIRGMIDNRDVWPNILADVSNMLASARPQPELLSGSPDEIASIPPAERRLLELKSLDYTFVAPRGEQTMPQLRLRMRVESSNKDSVALVNKSVIQWLGQNAERPGVPYRILRDLPENQPKTVRIDAMKTPPADSTPGQSTGGRGPGRGSEGGGFEVGGFEGSGFTKGRGGFGGEGMAVSGGVTPGSNRYMGNSSLNLDSLAPLPTPAATLPPDTDYYQVEVSWIIQLVDPNAPATTDGATGQEGK